MNNLVERIRAACDGHPHAKIEWPHRILHEAADRIEALEAALREIVQKRKMDAVAATSMQAIARAALAPEKDK